VYKIYLLSNATRQLKRLQKKARSRFDEINKVFDQLSVDPKTESILLKDPILRGFRRAKADEDRIRFRICEECREDQLFLKNRKCVDCHGMPENAIKIFDIEHRRSVYKKHKIKR